MYWCSNDRVNKFAETILSGKNGLDRILEFIKTAERWTFSAFAQTIGYKNFDNPYFGCHSLEEMLIKKDLLDASLDRER